MPKTFGHPIDFYENTVGLTTMNSGIRVPNGACKDVKNVNYFPVGGFSSRNGYVRLNGTALNSGAIMTSLYEKRQSSGTHLLIGTCGNMIAKMDALDGTWDDLTAALTLTAGENNLWSWAILNDIAVGSNGVDNCIQVSTVPAAATIGTGSFSTALFVVEYRGYMFYGNLVEGGTAFPDRFRFSNNAVPGTFTATDLINVHTKQGGTLRGAIVYKDRLLCFKENAVYEIIFSPTRVASDGTLFPFLQNPNPLLIGIGAQSHRTLVHFTTPSTHSSPGDYIFFIDQRGMPRIYASGTTSFQVGYPIGLSRDTVIESISACTRSQTALRSMWAMDYPERNQIWVFMPLSTQMNRCWVLDYTVDWAWGKNVFADSFTCGTLVQHTDGTYRPFTGDRAGFTVRHDTGTRDHLTNIDWYYRTGDVRPTGKSPVERSNWPFCEVKGTTGSDSQAINIAFSKDSEDIATSSDTVTLYQTQAKWGAGTIWGQFKWAKKGLMNRTITPNIDAKTLGTKFSSVNGSQATIEGFTLIAKEEGLAHE